MYIEKEILLDSFDKYYYIIISQSSLFITYYKVPYLSQNFFFITYHKISYKISSKIL